jgi:opacity protein-like surface antigen
MSSAYRTTRFLPGCIVATIVLATAGTAHAQFTGGPSGFYVGLNGGVQGREIAEDINLGTAAEFARGFGISETIGYRFPVYVRAEFEFSMLDNNNSGFFFPVYPNGPREDSNGHITLRSYMANFYYDVPLRRGGPQLQKLSPFVGFGFGATESRINGVTTETLQEGIPGVFGPTVLDTASRFTSSWQFRLGASTRATSRLDVFAGWRHFETSQLNFKTIQFPDIQVKGANIDEFEWGIRIHF